MHIIDVGHGDPVVLIPGIQGRWEWTAPAIDALAKRCRVVTFSLCDEPSSGFAAEPSKGVENYLAQIETVFERAGLKEATLIGVSYSGPVAAEFAVRHPERVRALVLVSALPVDWVPDARARFYLRAPLLLSPVFLLDAPLRAFRELRAALPAWRHRLRFSARQAWCVMRYFVFPPRMANRITALRQFRFSDPARIQAPTLVITGEPPLDRVVPPGATRRYVDAIPGARYEMLKNTGHLGLITKPADFADLVCRFTSEIASHGHRASA